MPYISSGAKIDLGDGQGPRWCPTKKKLREMLAAHPGDVTIVTIGLGSTGQHRASELPDDGSVYQVAGPDPENKRNWFAQVKIVGGKAAVTA